MITPNSYMNPYYDAKEHDAVSQYIKSDAWITEYQITKDLEHRICEFTNTKFAHMVPSATAGLLIASMVAKIQPGTRFAVSAYTQAATINGALLLGGVPTILDVDEESHTIDFNNIPEECEVVFVTSINGRLSPNTKEKISKLQKRGVIVIEDSAQSLGSFLDTDHVGTIGDIGIFSFGSPKIITTGQGGCIVTNNKEYSNEINAIKNFGRTVTDGEIYNTFGLNFKFTDLQASLGMAQFDRIHSIIDAKKRIYNTYKYFLQNHVEFVETSSSVAPVYPDIIHPHRHKIISALKKHNIGYRTAYPSLISQPYHSKYKSMDTPNTNLLSDNCLHLPGQPNLTTEDIDFITSVIKRAIQ